MITLEKGQYSMGAAVPKRKKRKKQIFSMGCFFHVVCSVTQREDYHIRQTLAQTARHKPDTARPVGMVV